MSSPGDEIFSRVEKISCPEDKWFSRVEKISCPEDKWFSRSGFAKFAIFDFSHACFLGFGFQKRIMLVCRS